MSRSAIVLGAGGFLGRAVLAALAAEPRVDRLTAHFHHVRHPDDAAARTESCTLDLVTAPVTSIADLLDRCDATVVVNCVGAISEPYERLRTLNIDVVAKIADALKGRDDVHLIHLGSAAEYGPQPANRAIGERARAFPTTDYGITKLQGTRRAIGAAAEAGPTVTVLRVFNPLGRDSAPTTLPGRAARAVVDAHRGGHQHVCLGNLGSWRDFIDARDVGRAVAAAALFEGRGGQILNVGRGEAVLTRDLVKRLAAIIGFTGQIVETDDGSTRSSSVAWQRADITTTTSRLGWVPRYSIDDSLHDLWSGACAGVHT